MGIKTSDFTLIMRRCGHKHKLSSKNSVRINILKNSLCRKCRQVQVENDRNFVTHALSLPLLEGSHEEIIHATSTRADFAIKLIDKTRMEQDETLFLTLRRSAAWWLAHKHELTVLYNCFLETGYLSKD